MQYTPGNKGPAGAMPQTTDEKGNAQTKYNGHFTPIAFGDDHWRVQVIIEPGG